MEDGSARRQWLGVEFRHLAALAAIAEEGTFRAAADRLGYVQSAVSQQIAALERALGTRLIERSPGSQPLVLTNAGHVLLEHFEGILVKLGAARADVEALGTGRVGVVRLGLSPSVEARVVPEVLLRLARDTDISLRVTECADDAACAALVESRVDAAIVSAPLPEAPLVEHRLLADPLVLLVQAGTPLAWRGTPPSLHEIGALSPRVLSLAWHAERRLSPALETFCDATIAVCRDIQRRLDEQLSRPSCAAAPCPA